MKQIHFEQARSSPMKQVNFEKFEQAFFEIPKADPKKVASIILGVGAGTRLFPLTSRRAKPAVPIGGCYRLIDVPTSNCINNGIRKIFSLTQFNSFSLNRHLARTYNFGNGANFGDGFVEDTIVMGAYYYQTEPEVVSLLAEEKIPVGVG